MENNTFFYHSFPRPREGEIRKKLLARGLAILRSIRRTGLILAPEVVEWTTPVSLGSPSPFRVLQERVCFTALLADELPAHSLRFGPYSIRPRGLPLQPRVREELLSVDGRFWKLELQIEDQRFRRVDRPVSLAFPPPEHVISAMTRVLVPDETFRQAQELFADLPVEVHRQPFTG